MRRMGAGPGNQGGVLAGVPPPLLLQSLLGRLALAVSVLSWCCWPQVALARQRQMLPRNQHGRGAATMLLRLRLKLLPLELLLSGVY